MARNRDRVNDYGQLLDIAASIFDTNGYHESSMQDIADAAGLTKGGLYHHLSSKEETLFAISERYMINGRAEADKILSDNNTSVVVRLRDFVIATAAQHDIYAPDLRLSLREMDRLGLEFRRELLEMRHQYQKAVEILLERGIETGELRNEDPALMVKFVFGAVNWMCMWYRTDDRYSAEQIGRKFADWIVDALAAPQSNRS